MAVEQQSKNGPLLQASRRDSGIFPDLAVSPSSRPPLPLQGRGPRRPVQALMWYGIWASGKVFYQCTRYFTFRSQLDVHIITLPSPFSVPLYHSSLSPAPTYF